MRVDFAFLCDSAAESNGKIHALGIGLEQIGATSLPAVHPRAVAVVRFSFSRDDVGLLDFVVYVRDADWREAITPVQGEMALTMADEASQMRANMVIELQQLTLQAYGPHEVQVRVDGDEAVALRFEVVPMPASTPLAGTPPPGDPQP
ncbi:MAG: hypothetical protein Q7K37_08645 [Dehalococcoidia bacterium]|nr:hypothetical protein [Dehalococcoidia bacterium]